jgi:hypothetical protein
MTQPIEQKELPLKVVAKILIHYLSDEPVCNTNVSLDSIRQWSGGSLTPKAVNRLIMLIYRETDKWIIAHGEDDLFFIPKDTFSFISVIINNKSIEFADLCSTLLRENV